MKKLLALSLVLMLAVGLILSQAYAATKVGTFGVPNASGTSPMEVDSDRKITIASDANLEIEGDFTLYESATDPCGILAAKSLFFNSNTGGPCFCNSLGVDLSLYDGSTACY